MREKRFRLILLVALIGIVAVILFNTISASRVVDANSGRDKQFTSIQVKKGDSLWSIAKKHMSDEYESIDDYIDEVRETNHISDYTVKKDMYLVIPYYKSNASHIR